MKLQTHIELAEASHQIDYHSKVLLLGSCFSDNIGKKFEYYKFDALVNPFGVLFNPIAIEKLVKRAVANNFFSEKDLFFHNEQWHCFEVHSSLSANDKESFLRQLNKQLALLRSYLESASHLVVTYGTSWVYQKKDTNQIVANCHKVPQTQFNKRLLTILEVETSIKNSVNAIKGFNKKAILLFTVSPVRHLKDGFIENNRSKAHLIAAIHNSLNSQSFYFPSFEIMMDQLRDYRFYKEDMLHPNNLAITVIWEKFKSVWITPEVEGIMKQVALIQKGLAHKPFNEQSQATIAFKKQLQEKIAALQAQLPHISF